MSLTRRVAHNTIIQFAGKVVSTILGVAAVAIITRYLGREGYGQYSTIVAYLQLFGIFTDFGLNLMTVQAIAEIGEDQAKTNKIVSNIFTIRLVSAIILFGLAPLIVVFFPYPLIVKIGIALTTLSFFCIVLLQIISSVFQKALRMDKLALAEVIGRVFLVAGTALAAYFQTGLLGVMGAIILGSVVNFLVAYLYSLKYVRIRLAFDFAYWREIMVRSWPIGLSVIFNLVYLKTDTLILSLFRTQEEVGIYGAPYRVLEIMIMFPIMFAGIILPILASSWAKNDIDKFRKIMQKAFDFLSIIAIPLVVGTWFLAKPIMVLVAGKEFAPSAPVLQILIIATGVIFIGNLFAHAVVALQKQRPMILAYLATAVIALTGYLIFIPRYSYFGAAWMTVAAESFIALIAFIMVCKTIGQIPSFAVFGKSLVASFFMGIAIYFLQDYNLFLVFIIASAVYFAVLFLLKGFTKEMIKEIAKFEAL